ncbi:MAG TPA: YdcF family protein, partial [Nevskiaceae bacterium]|nr:YdcF family protein [Nevskiaceae bacterium]
RAALMFVLSKIVGTLLAPATVLFALLLLSWLLHARRPRASRRLLGLALALLALLGLAPVSNWVLHPLESRFAPPSGLHHVDGIVVLGGAIDAGGSAYAHDVELNAHAERLTTLVALARRYPQARMIYSGGSADVLQKRQLREADLAPSFFEGLGLSPDRVELERDSRNTWENALYSQRLAQPRPGETWLLVTSAWHMPRAVGCFRELHWAVVPYPVDYQSRSTGWGGFDIATKLEMLTEGSKEWIGLVSYRLLGRIPELLPGPETGA